MKPVNGNQNRIYSRRSTPHCSKLVSVHSQSSQTIAICHCRGSPGGLFVKLSVNKEEERHELTWEQSLVSSILPARREDRLQSADHFSCFSARRSVSIFPAVSLHVLNRCLGSSRSWRLYQWLNNYDQDIDFLNSRKGTEGWTMFLWGLRGSIDNGRGHFWGECQHVCCLSNFPSLKGKHQRKVLLTYLNAILKWW